MNGMSSLSSGNDVGLLPGGVPSIFKTLPDRYIEMGKGGRCFDQYGNDYIDFICGFGSVILGHNHNGVNEAVKHQLNKGVTFSSSSPIFDELNSAIKQLFPYSGDIVIVKTGSEAVAVAIRLARAFTNKTKIIRCGFHGWHDEMIAPFESWHLYEPDPLPPRTVPGVNSYEHPTVFSWTGADFQTLQKLFQKHKGEVAALIIDPIQLRQPSKSQFNELKKLTKQENALLIFDEIKTGFHVNLSGVQGLYGIYPDITVLSKGIANGFPLAMALGKPEIMQLVPHIKIMGTYNNELISAAASLKTLSILQESNYIEMLWGLGQKLINGLNSLLIERGLEDHIQAVPYQWPSLPAVWLKQKSDFASKLKPILFHHLVKNGVLLLANHPNFICMQHTEKDIQDALDRFEAALRISCQIAEF